MARPASFDRCHVLQQAIRLFRLKGYHATSIKDLVAATGLRPGSLYAAFGDKRGLFLMALDAYYEDMKQSMFCLLHRDEPPVRRLEAFFMKLIDHACGDSGNSDCLLINTLAEIGFQDEQIGVRLQRMFGEVERELTAVLVDCERAGLLNDKRGPALSARFLVSGIFGLRLFSKTLPPREELETLAKLLVASVIPSYEP
ncbi:MAG: TetR/AcrR family transcriptional regulator [Methylomicrobium sp.]|nr:TetR/AcrR family transcriptional regulator [Methylomicrobium sp.]